MDTAYFSNSKIAEIFAINNSRIDSKGYERKGLYVNNREDGTHEEIDYNTCMCMYHNQANQSSGGFPVKVVNVIDIESPGIVTVYSSKDKFSKIDFSDEAEARRIFTSELNGKDSEFDYTKIKKRISSFAYLSYRAFERAEYGNGLVEQAMDYLWKDGGKYSIRKISQVGGNLNSAFDIGWYKLDSDDKPSDPNAPEDEIPEGYDVGDGGKWRNVAGYQVQNMLEKATIEKIPTNDIDVEYDDNYAYIGPLMATFEGGTPIITVEGIEANWARQKNDLSFEINTGDLISSDQYAFYAVIDKNAIPNKENINVKLTLNYSKYKARLILTRNAKEHGQQLMFHAGKKEDAVMPISWDVGITEKVNIQKQDATGQNLNASGIKFEVYTLDNVKVGSLTTDENGKVDINLKPGTTYKIKETKNTHYGYKNTTISGASMTVTTADGATTTEELNVVNGEAQFTIRAGADHVINIRNTPQLGNLTIRKLDENGNPIEGAEFIIWQNRNWGYININGEAKHTTSSAGTDIKELYQQGNISGGGGAYVNGTTTHYVTNENGEIVLKNLEIYHTKGVKYNYVIREMSNTSYGYKGMYMTESDITLYEPETSEIKGSLVDDMYVDDGKTDGGKDTILKKAQFTIGDATEVTMVNRPQLGNLTIKKVDENGNPMAGVEFVIWESNKWGYINISGETEHITPTTGTDIKALYEEGKISGGGGTLTDTTTRYITNEEGLIVLNNLEIYHSIDKKCEYVIREMSNNNHGYKAMIMADEDITISEAEGSEIEGSFVEDLYTGDEIVDGGKDALRKKARFTIGNNTTVEIANTPKIRNLVIHKKDDNNVNLANVEFTIYQAVNNESGYIRLIKNSQFVETINEEIDINDYDVEYVRNDDEDYLNKATRFITNTDGKIIINNLEVYLGLDSEYNPVKYKYWVCEEKNDLYGYRHMIMTEEDLSVDGGEIIELKPEEHEVGFTLNDQGTTVTVEAVNTEEVANLEIIKVNQNSQSMEKVEFVITTGTNEYIVLKDANGESKASVDETVTINIDNTFEENEYSVEYSKDKSKATKFITDNLGKIHINNIEIYSPTGEKYKYKVWEEYNPNYGYGSTENIGRSKEITDLKAGELYTVTFTNTKELTGFSMIKVDEDYRNIVIPGTKFVIEATTDLNDKYSYVVLENNEGLIKEVTGAVTINENNKITEDENQYKLKYYNTFSEYSEAINDKVTIFTTDENGIIEVNNLEVNERTTGEKYKYRLIEIENPSNSYEIKLGQYAELEMIDSTNETIIESEYMETSAGETPELIVPNTPKYTKISGYVWVEQKEPTKTNNPYDCVYTETGADIKLSDIYIIDEETGELIYNEKAQVPVEIKLYKWVNSKWEVIKSKPDKFRNDNGEYTFENLDIYVTDEATGEIVTEIVNGKEEKVREQYYVSFEYDGFFYTTVTPNINIENGSKVIENEIDRSEINGLFEKVKYDNEIVNAGNGTAEVYYNKIEGQRESNVTGFSVSTKVKTDMLVNIADKLHELKSNAKTPIEGVNNINMGLLLREQPKMIADSDINSVLIGVNGYNYTYYYDAIDINYSNSNDDDYWVKFEREKGMRYTQNVYSSDVDALKNGVIDDMTVSIIYKIPLTNDSETLTTVVHEIENYFDADYEIEAIGLGIQKNRDNEGIVELTNIISESMYVKNEDVEVTGSVQEGKKYNSVRIKLGENGITIPNKDLPETAEKDNVANIYIKFNVDKEAILGLLDEKSTYYNATEIISYSTYYAENTGKDLGIDVITENKIETDKTRVGQTYAGITKGSAPGNIKLELVPHPSGEGTPVLYTEEFELDSTAAPSLVLKTENDPPGTPDPNVPEGARTISGNVFEDLPSYTENNEKLGNGIYDNGENKIQNVKVELCIVNEDGSIGNVATYSDGVTKISTETDSNGKYTLGYYDEANDRYVGILPGVYVIRYTYGVYESEEKAKKSYIVDSESGNVINDINVMDYKSTIINSENTHIINDYSTVENIINEYKAKAEGEEKTSIVKQIENSINTDSPIGRWFAKENKEKYSSGRDNINLRAEYSNEWGEKTIKNSLVVGGLSGSQKLKIDQMVSYTPVMYIGQEFTEKDYENAISGKDENGELVYRKFEKQLANVNFGIIERPNIDIRITKKITGMEIIAQNGASLIPKGNPSDLNSKMQYVANVDGKVSAQIDSNLLQGAILNLEYTVEITNNSERDYLNSDYYYYGTRRENENTSNAKLIVDYLDKTMTLDTTKKQDGIWKKATMNELLAEGLIDNNVAKALGGNEEGQQNYHAFTTSAFADVDSGSSKAEKMYVTRKLAASDSIHETNRVEIVELTGRRLIKDSIPGNYVPVEEEALVYLSGGGGNTIGNPSTDDENGTDDEPILIGYALENDSAKADCNIFNPTGTTVDYKMYIIATISMLIIVSVGIVIIKKKIIKS